MISLIECPATSARPSGSDEVRLRDEWSIDWAARERLLDEAFGIDRYLKTSQRLREGRMPAPGLALSACQDDRLVGTLRLWPIEAAGRPALLLGPLAVTASHRARGLGARLMAEGLFRALTLGHTAVVLVGDPGYYERFGFDARLTRGLVLPGPVERRRFLGLELAAGALEGVRGRVRPALHSRPSALQAA